jgi:hypothetical protein
MRSISRSAQELLLERLEDARLDLVSPDGQAAIAGALFAGARSSPPARKGRSEAEWLDGAEERRTISRRDGHYLATAMLIERTNVTNETRRLEDRQEMTARCRLGCGFGASARSPSRQRHRQRYERRHGRHRAPPDNAAPSATPIRTSGSSTSSPKRATCGVARNGPGERCSRVCVHPGEGLSARWFAQRPLRLLVEWAPVCRVRSHHRDDDAAAADVGVPIASRSPRTIRADHGVLARGTCRQTTARALSRRQGAAAVFPRCKLSALCWNVWLRAR